MDLPYDTRDDSGDPAEDVQPRRANVTTRATRIWSTLGRGDVLLVNRDLTHTVHVGDATVDTDALPIPPLGSVVVPAGRDWFGVTDSGAAVLWAIPGASNYSPSPAETAAQIAADPLTVNVDGLVDVSGSTVDASGSAVGIVGTVPVSGPPTAAQIAAGIVANPPAVGITGTVPVSGPPTAAQIAAGIVANPPAVGITGTPAVTQAVGSQLRNAAGSATQPVTTQVPATFFGSGSDGDVTINIDTSLTGHKQYNNLTLAAGVSLRTNGWIVYVKGTLTFGAAARIHNNGGDGGSGGNGTTTAAGTAGTAGTAAPAGVFTASAAGAPGPGGAANSASAANGNGGVAGTNVVTSTSTIGGPGGTGGTGAKSGSSTPGAGGSGGTVPGATGPLPAIDSSFFRQSQGPGAGGGSGGSGSVVGSGGAFGTSGGGGGAGAGGGTCCVLARTVTGNGTIQANGGNGGNGGDGNRGTTNASSWGGGSGGGSGGGGGEAMLLCESMAGGFIAGNVQANGGNGGNGGANAAGASPPASIVNATGGSAGVGGGAYVVPVSVA